MLIRWAIAAAVLFVLAGCLQRYVAPTAGPTARVYFHNMSPIMTFITIDVYYNETCDPEEKGGRIGVVSAKQRIAHAQVEANKLVVLTVDGRGQPKHVAYLTTTTPRCGSTVQFTPQSNQNYKLAYSTDGVQCSVRITRLSEDLKREFPEKFRGSAKSCVRR